MQSEDFRRLVLALPEVVEKSHFGQVDFRVGNKIFAALPVPARGVVKLRPEQRDVMVAAEPKIFAAQPGGWGKQGWTRIELAGADAVTLKSALTAAWKNVAPKKLLASSKL
jgi:hypothetical protein